MSDFPPWARDMNDFFDVPDRVLALALPKVDSSLLALALITASPDLRDRVFSFLSETISELIREEMGFLGPVRLQDVEAAQKRLVDSVNSTP